MNEKIKRKIENLLALANDANDEESMTALAKAQELMLTYQITEDEILDYKQQQKAEPVLDSVIYEGRPHKWVYRLANIISNNFRVRYYYNPGPPVRLHFIGMESDVHIANITFEYARGSIMYCSRSYLNRPEIKRKRKRKWELKQDYIEGYLRGLSKVFNQQVLTNGYELALQVPAVVELEVEKLGLVSGKDLSHKIKDKEAFWKGYNEGINFRNKELLT